jgi:hypothetical protein
LGAHAGLIEEYTAKMVAIRKNLGLMRQVCPARIDQIDAGQTVLLGDLLSPQVLFDRNREIGPAFDGRVIGHDHDFTATDPPNAGNDPSRWSLIIIHTVGRQSPDFEEGCPDIEQALNPLPRQELAARNVTLTRRGWATERRLIRPLTQRLSQALIERVIGPKCRGIWVDLGDNSAHFGLFFFD